MCFLYLLFYWKIFLTGERIERWQECHNIFKLLICCKNEMKQCHRIIVKWWRFTEYWIQLKPHSSPWFTPCVTAITQCNNYFHQYHWNATTENKIMFCDPHNHCKRVLRCEVQLCWNNSMLCCISAYWISWLLGVESTIPI